MRYYIRYNVDHKNGKSDLPWKVFESEDKFYLTRNVILYTISWTGDTPFPDGGFKYSIYCDGKMTSCDENEIVIE
jgi:hypothetical protein